MRSANARRRGATLAALFAGAFLVACGGRTDEPLRVTDGPAADPDLTAETRSIDPNLVIRPGSPGYVDTTTSLEILGVDQAVDPLGVPVPTDPAYSNGTYAPPAPSYTPPPAFTPSSPAPSVAATQPSQAQPAERSGSAPAPSATPQRTDVATSQPAAATPQEQRPAAAATREEEPARAETTPARRTEPATESAPREATAPRGDTDELTRLAIAEAQRRAREAAERRAAGEESDD